MSPGTRLAVTSYWEYAAFVVNSIVFLLIGIEVTDFDWTQKIGVALAAVLVVLVGRAAIYPLSWVVNYLLRDKGSRVPRSWQHILFWGGLRGALSMALVLGLSESFPQRETLIAATFGVVLFSLLVQGLTIGPLLRRLGLTRSQDRDPNDEARLKTEIMATRAALAYLEQMLMGETFPRWIVETLTAEYDRRLFLLQSALEAARPHRGLAEEQHAAEARSLVLAAERSAFRDAQQQGLLDDEDWRQISARIDAELLALKLKLTEH